MEWLAERFVTLADEASEDVFETPLVVVQGVGMERWLAQYGARRFGVFAAVKVVRVRMLVKLVCDTVLAGHAAADEGVELDPDTLTFRVLAALDDVIATPEGAPLRDYLSAKDDPERRAQLAERLGEAIDRYGVHRPDLLADWEAGRVDEDPLARAQAAVFLRVVASAPAYEAKRIARAMALLPESRDAVARALPRRVHIFGVATLAPPYLDLLRRLSDVLDVHLYVLSPGEEWLSDLSHDETRAGDVGSLIRGFGKLAAEFQSLLEEAGDTATEYVAEAEPEPTTILGTLQHDLRTLTRRGDPGDGRERKVVVAGDDRTFVVHACHSQRRELEVLRDVLLDALERDPTLEPQDIAVLAPDIEAYAPLVHAVFQREPADPGAVPYHVADRGARAGSPMIDAFVAIREALRARFTLPLLADLLARPAIAARQGLAVEEAESAIEWLLGAGGRWGLDACDRAAEGQLDLVEHTFERALDRLALGFASGRDDAQIGDVLSKPIPGGKSGLALGGILTFFDTFTRVRERARVARTVGEHADVARNIVDSLLSAEPGDEDDALRIRAAATRVVELANESGFVGELSADAFGRALTGELESGGGGGGFLKGGITFCKQVPMRAIPFRVLALLGLDDESYPRNVEPPRFDLIAKSPRRGDRTTRDDDRQAFLDALLSARDALHVFHVGRDIANDRERPVSTVVARTLEVVERATVLADGGGVHDLVFVEHPLHAFDPACFVADARDRGIASRDPSAHAAAMATRIVAAAEPPELSLDGIDAPREITLDQLLEFLKDPEKDFVKNVLGAEADVAKLDLPEREELENRGLPAHAVRQLALTHLEHGGDPEAFCAIARARGVLPPGTLGESAALVAVGFAEDVLERAGAHTKLPAVRFELVLPSARLVGTLTNLTESGIVELTASNLNDDRKFLAFTRHLVLASLRNPPVPVSTRLVGRLPSSNPPSADTYEAGFPSDVDPREALDALARAYLAGRSEPQLVSCELLAEATPTKRRRGGLDAAVAALRKSVLEQDDARDEQLPSDARRTLFADVFAPRAEIGPDVLGRTFEDVRRHAYGPFTAGGEGDEA